MKYIIFLSLYDYVNIFNSTVDRKKEESELWIDGRECMYNVSDLIGRKNLWNQWICFYPSFAVVSVNQNGLFLQQILWVYRY